MCTLAHVRVYFGILLDPTQMILNLALAHFYKQINQGNLHQRRLLVLKSIHQPAANLRIVFVPPQSIEGSEANVHAVVETKGMEQGRCNLRIGMLDLRAVVHSLQPLAGRLLCR